VSAEMTKRIKIEHDVMLSVTFFIVMLSVLILRVDMLSVVMKSVSMPNAVMVRVVAPYLITKTATSHRQKLSYLTKTFERCYKTFFAVI